MTPPLPPPPFPPSPCPRPVRDDNGGWRSSSLCASLCSFASLRFMPIQQEQLGSLLYSSKPSASLLSSLSPSFEFHSIDRHIFPPSDDPSSISLAPLSSPYPQQLTKHHPLWQTLLPHTCYESSKQNPPFARYRLYALGICLGKRVGVRYGVVVALPFPPS